MLKLGTIWKVPLAAGPVSSNALRVPYQQRL